MSDADGGLSSGSSTKTFVGLNFLDRKVERYFRKIVQISKVLTRYRSRLLTRVYGQRAHCILIGTPADVADPLEIWYRGGSADGFNVMPLTFHRGLEDFVGLLIPELRRRGLFRKEYEGKTLRQISACRLRQTAGRLSERKRMRG